MKNALSFRIRTLLIAVSVFAVLAAITPKIWWRWRVNLAVDEVVTNGPDPSWLVTPLAPNANDTYAYLASDHHRVFKQLIEIGISDESYERRSNALNALQLISSHQGSYEAREQGLEKLIEAAINSAREPVVTDEILSTIDHWIPSTGVSPECRVNILENVANSESQNGWVRVIDAIGGRREVEILLKMGDRSNSQLEFMTFLQVKNVTWSGILPHLKLWLKDPGKVDHALKFSALTQTHTGRELLLELVFSQSHTSASRLSAVKLLAENEAGIELLADSCNEESSKSELETLIKNNAQVFLAAEKKKLEDQYGRALWQELIEGLSPDHWIPGVGSKAPTAVREQVETIRERRSKSCLKILRILSGNEELESQADWQSWLESRSPPRVELQSLLTLIVAHPEMLDNSSIRRRLLPYRWGYIPDECLPLYEKLTSSSEASIRYLGCEALLAYTDSEKAIDAAIDMIDISPPGNAASVRPGAIFMLQRRFAVNFFWDTEAWRDWAQKRQEDK